MRTFTQSSKAFTLVEIMIVVAITGILISIAVPAWVRARDSAAARACQENLSKIDGAKEVYALEHNLGNGGTVQLTDLFDATAKTGYLRKKPICPASGVYSTNPVGDDPTCSYNGQEFFAEFPHALQ